MSFLKRLKRLWVLTEESEDTRPSAASHDEVVQALKEIFPKDKPRLATVLQDDPLDIFPSEEDKLQEDHDTTS